MQQYLLFSDTLHHVRIHNPKDYSFSIQDKIDYVSNNIDYDIYNLVLVTEPYYLLGAKIKPSIYKVVDKDILQLDLDLSDWTIQTILTSPIFDLQSVIPLCHNTNKSVNTEDTYIEMVKNQKVRDRLKSVGDRLNLLK